MVNRIVFITVLVFFLLNAALGWGAVVPPEPDGDVVFEKIIDTVAVVVVVKPADRPDMRLVFVGVICTDGSNWYVYCYNNPLKFVDPNGLDVYIGITNIMTGAGTLAVYNQSGSKTNLTTTVPTYQVIVSDDVTGECHYFAATRDAAITDNKGGVSTVRYEPAGDVGNYKGYIKTEMWERIQLLTMDSTSSERDRATLYRSDTGEPNTKTITIHQGGESSWAIGGMIGSLGCITINGFNAGDSGWNEFFELINTLLQAQTEETGQSIIIIVEHTDAPNTSGH